MQEWYEICDRLKSLIADYDERYGYLGADWNGTLEQLYGDGEPLVFRVYFENDERADIILERGEWAPSDWLDFVVDDTLSAAQGFLEQGRISTMLPEHIEFA